MTAPIDIGSRLELFVDRYLIQALDRATLELHRPVDKGVVFSLDLPWEGNYSSYPSVVKLGDRFHFYNRGMRRLAGDQMAGGATFAFPAVTCCRISDDGITWRQPSFGLFEFDGSTDNNIVWKNTDNADPWKGYSTCFYVSLNSNPDASLQERYIGLAPTKFYKDGKEYLRHSIFTSPDGVHFSMKPHPVLEMERVDDGHCVFWDSNLGQYAAYLRVWYNPTTGKTSGFELHRAGGYRWVWRTLSADLANWSVPELLRFKNASGGEGSAEHLYTFPSEQYFRAPHLYLAMPTRFVQERKAVPDFYREGVNDGVLLTSRDGLTWDRTFMEAFIRPGRDPLNWTSKAHYPAKGIVQTGPDELSVYWFERGDHGEKPMRARRGALRLDGFASVSAGYAGGEMITRPLVFAGKHLVLNYSTSAAGSIRVEIQDANGAPIPGYALGDSPERYGDEIEGVVRWKNGPDVGALAGRPVRLRFVLKDADIYAMRFTDAVGNDGP